MASKEIAAMLDALMGRNRNLQPGTDLPQITWEDPNVCRYFLVQYCPHDLFTNTKADLGACPNIHDDDLKAAYDETPQNFKKEQCQEDFLRFAQRMLSDVGNKIKRSKERLLLDQREQLAANGISPQQQEEIEMKIEILTEKINGLVDQAEEAGNKGDVEEAQGILKLSDQLKEEREELKQSIGLKGYVGPEGQFGPPKAMEVCEICGAFLIVGDAQARIDDHLMGKLHVGYARLRASVDQLLEERARMREVKELEREREIAERANKKAEEADKKRTRSRSRDRKSQHKDRRRSRSRDSKRRSRSKDRRRDRSRERRRSRDRGSRRDHRDDRPRGDKDRDRRQRSKDRKSRDSKSRDRDGSH